MDNTKEFIALRDILVRVLGVYENEVNLDASFKKDLAADSLDLYQVLLEIEKEFEIRVDEEALLRIETVRDAINYIIASRK